jgi:hypothetical protein
VPGSNRKRARLAHGRAHPGLGSAMERAHAVIAEDGGNAALAMDCGSSFSCWRLAF